jgi:hypothetical protein
MEELLRQQNMLLTRLVEQGEQAAAAATERHEDLLRHSEEIAGQLSMIEEQLRKRPR